MRFPYRKSTRSLTCLFVFMLPFLILWPANAAAAGDSSPYKDPRMVSWSADFRAGRFQDVMRAAAADYASPSPHPLAGRVWAFAYAAARQESGQLDVSSAPHELLELAAMEELWKKGQSRKIVQTYLPRANEARDVETLNLLGLALWDQAQYEKALACYRRSLSLAPNQFMIAWRMFNLVEADEREWKPVKALAEGDELSSTRAGRFLRTMMSSRPLTEPLMLEASGEWLSVDGHDPHALYFRAIHLMRVKRWDDALKDLVEAGDADPFLLSVQTYRNEVLARLGRTEELEVAAASVARLHPIDGMNTKARIRQLLALAYTSADQPERAVNILLDALKTFPNEPHLLAALADANLALRNFGDAARYAEMAIQSSPDRDEAWRTLIESLNQQKRYGDAFPAFLRAEQQDSNVSQRLFADGHEAASHLDDPALDLALCRRARASYANSGWMLRLEAEALARSGKNDEALQALVLSMDIAVPGPWAFDFFKELTAKSSGTSELHREAAKLKDRYAWNLTDVKVPAVLEGVAPLARSSATSGVKNTAVRLQVQVGHQQPVSHMVVTDDGKLLLSADEGGTIKIWDVSTGMLLRDIVAHSSRINDMVLDSTKGLVATAGEDGTVKVWSLSDGAVVWSSPVLPRSVTSVALDREHDRIACAVSAADQPELTLLEWSLTDGSLRSRIDWWTKGKNALARGLQYLPGTEQVAVRGAEDGLQIWEFSTRRLVQQNSDILTHYALANKSGLVYFQSGDSVVAAELLSGRRKDRWQLPSRIIEGISVDANGSPLVTFRDVADEKIHLWSVQQHQDVYTANVPASENVTSWTFLTSRKEVLIASAVTRHTVFRPYIALLDLSIQKEVQRFEGNADIATTAAFDRSGSTLVLGQDSNRIRVWNLKDGTVQGVLASLPEFAFVADRPSIASCGPSGDFSLRLWDIQNLKIEKQFPYACAPENAPVSAADTATVAVSSGSDVLLISQAGEVTKLHASPGAGALAFSKNGKRLAVATVGQLKICEIEPADCSTSLLDGEGTVRGVAFSSDGALLAAAVGGDIPRQPADPSDKFSLYVWDLDSGRKLLWSHRTSEGFGFNTVAFSPDSKYLASGGDDKRVRLWDARTGEPRANLEGHGGLVSSVAFTPDGRFLISSSEDGTQRLWDVGERKLAGILVSFADGAWAALDPRGRFDASNGGDVPGLHLVVGNEPAELNQLKSRYYDPHLLAKIFGYNREPFKVAETVLDAQPYPLVQVHGGMADPSQAEIRLSNRGGGIGQVKVFVNGKEVMADARGPRPNRNAAEETIRLSLSQYRDLMIPGAENHVTIVAYNGDGYFSSRGFQIPYTPPKESSPQPVHIWGLVAGVSNYQGDLRPLNFAAKDAEAFFAALRLAAERLAPGQTDIRLLTSSSKAEEDQPTKQNIVAEINKIAGKAKASDIFVLYLAGHGVSYGGVENGDFYFLTARASTSDLRDPAIRASSGLSGEDLANLAIKVPALKQVMILDSCASGRAIEQLEKTSREVEGSVIRSWDRMKDRAGLWVLAGAAADAVSYESSRYGQGLLTYSLLLAMKQDWQQALRKDDRANQAEYLDVSKLFAYSEDEVPKLARGIGGIQKPVISRPQARSSSAIQAASFDIGRIVSEDRAKIPLASAKPVFSRSRFELEDQPEDPLALTKMVDDHLRDLAGRGQDSGLVFWDVPDQPGAYHLAGRYQIDGSHVKVNFYLSKIENQDGKLTRKRVGASYSAEGETESLDRLLQEMLSRAEQLTTSDSTGGASRSLP